MLTGQGGFGKTTLAALAYHDPSIVKRFGERRYWLTIGESAREPDLEAALNDLIIRISGAPTPYSTLERRMEHLADLVSGRPTLLVVDDVWMPGQLNLFALCRCTLLITSRWTTFPDASLRVVDRMDDRQASALLTAGLPGADEADWSKLLRLGGGWPILLTLVHNLISYWVGVQKVNVGSAVRHVTERIEAEGPTALDPEPDHQTHREQAVATVVRASVNMLASVRHRHWSQRFDELAVVPKGAAIPLTTLAAFWRDQMPSDEVEKFCHALARLSLVQDMELGEVPSIRLHDVIHDYLTYAQKEALPSLHRRLVEVHAEGEWWELPRTEPYMWSHLAYHLSKSEPGGADAVVCDLRWVEARLLRDGPTAIDSDLTHATSERAARLREVLTRSAHLFAPLAPSLTATIASRLLDIGELADLVEARERTLQGNWLVPVWPLPDRPASAFRGAIGFGAPNIVSFALSADETWIATGHEDGSLRTWDTATGDIRATARPHRNAVNAIKIIRNELVVSADFNGHINFWDPKQNKTRRAVEYTTWYSDVAVDPTRPRVAVCGGRDLGIRFFSDTGEPKSPVPRWKHPLTTISTDENRVGEIPFWPVMTLTIIAGVIFGPWAAAAALVTLPAVLALAALIRLRRGRDTTTYLERAYALSYSADGKLLATASTAGEIRVWNARTGRVRKTFDAARTIFGAAAIDPSGTWLASATAEDGFRLRHIRSGRVHVTEPLPMQFFDYNVCFSRDSKMVACAAGSRVKVWTVADGRLKAELTGLPHDVTGMSFTADNTSLLTAGGRSVVRKWHLDDLPADASERHGDPLVRAVAFMPDGERVVVGGPESEAAVRTVRGTHQLPLPGHTQPVSAVGTAHDGSWLATGDFEGTVRLWRPDGTPIAAPIEHPRAVGAIVTAPDGWLAVGYADNTIRVYDLAGRTRTTLTATPKINDVQLGITGLAVTSNGARLVSADHTGEVQLWDTASWRVLQIVRPGHDPSEKVPRSYYRVAISSEGRWLAATDHDRAIDLHDLDSGQVRHLRGHRASVSDVSFSPNGDMLASVDFDGVIRIWRISEHRCTAVLRVDGALHACTWSPTNDHIAVSGRSGVYLFQLRPAQS